MSKIRFISAFISNPINVLSDWRSRSRKSSASIFRVSRTYILPEIPNTTFPKASVERTISHDDAKIIFSKSVSFSKLSRSVGSGV